jgi:hypothetical protein
MAGQLQKASALAPQLAAAQQEIAEVSSSLALSSSRNAVLEKAFTKASEVSQEGAAAAAAPVLGLLALPARQWACVGGWRGTSLHNLLSGI